MPFSFFRVQGLTMFIYPTDRNSLERDCAMEFIIAGGPGGQHRNKVESGVRLTHRPTGLVVTATERRSQTANRQAAFLRMAIRLTRLQRVRKPRRKTQPTETSRQRRLEGKSKRSELKRSRTLSRESQELP
jgi:protein subunit release factor B